MDGLCIARHALLLSKEGPGRTGSYAEAESGSTSHHNHTIGGPRTKWRWPPSTLSYGDRAGSASALNVITGRSIGEASARHSCRCTSVSTSSGPFFLGDSNPTPSWATLFMPHPAMS